MVIARAASRRRRHTFASLAGPYQYLVPYPSFAGPPSFCGYNIAPAQPNSGITTQASLEVQQVFPPIHHHAVLPHLAAPVPCPVGDPPRRTQQQLLPSRLACLRPALHRSPSDDDRGGGVHQTPCPRRGRRRRVDNGESPTGRLRPTPRARRRFVRDRASDDGVGGKIKILPAGLPRSRHEGRGRRPVRDPLRPAADRVQRRHRTVRA